MRWLPLQASCQQTLVEMVGLSGSIVLAAADPSALLEVQATAGLGGPSHWRVPWPAGGQLALCL